MIFIFLTTLSLWAAKLNICQEHHINSLDPLGNLNESARNALHLKIYEPLYKYYSKKAILIPLLAKEISSQDEKVFTLKLRQGVSFHTNEYLKKTITVNADDVVFSFHRVMFSKKFDLPEKFSTQLAWIKKIKKVTKISKMSIQIQMHERTSDLKKLLTTLPIQSFAYYQKLRKLGMTKMFIKNPIGTGPFRFKKYQDKEFLRLEGFEKYFLGKPSLEELSFLSFTDNKKRADFYNFKLCDLVTNPSLDNIKKIKKGSYQIIYSPESAYMHLILNTNSLDINSRRAMMQAIKPKTIIDKLYSSKAFIDRRVLGNEIQSNLDKVQTKVSQIKKIRVILKENDLFFPDQNLFKQMLFGMLSKFSSQITIEFLPKESFNFAFKNNEFDLAFVDIEKSTVSHLKQLLQCETKGSIFCSSSLKTYFKLFKESKTQKRSDTLKRIIAKKLESKAYLYPLYHLKKLSLIRPTIENFYYIPHSVDDYSTIKIVNDKSSTE